MSKLAEIGEAARARAVREALLGAIERHGGNLAAAAASLGVDRRTIYPYAESAGITKAELRAVCKKYRARMS